MQRKNKLLILVKSVLQVNVLTNLVGMPGIPHIHTQDIGLILELALLPLMDTVGLLEKSMEEDLVSLFRTPMQTLSGCMV